MVPITPASLWWTGSCIFHVGFRSSRDGARHGSRLLGDRWRRRIGTIYEYRHADRDYRRGKNCQQDQNGPDHPAQRTNLCPQRLDLSLLRSGQFLSLCALLALFSTLLGA